MAQAGCRLDVWLGQRLPTGGRSAAQRLLAGGEVAVDGRVGRAGQRLRAGQRVEVQWPAPLPCRLVPLPMQLAVLFEDGDLLVLDKPPGLLVHPGAGAWRPTLVAGLLAHCRDLSGIGGVLRPGIVHRLDAATSGLMVVAKNDLAHRALAAQFAARQVHKEYIALGWGRPEPAAGTLVTAHGRHRVHRRRFAVWPQPAPAAGAPPLRSNGMVLRRAVTHWQVMAGQGPMRLWRLRPESGRTHQLRVHMAHLGSPIVGDLLYGRRPCDPPWSGGQQALHAGALAFAHPRSGRLLTFAAPPPPAFASLAANVTVGGGSR